MSQARTILNYSAFGIALFLTVLVMMLVASWIYGLLVDNPLTRTMLGLDPAGNNFLDFFDKSFGLAMSLLVALVAALLAKQALDMSRMHHALEQRQAAMEEASIRMALRDDLPGHLERLCRSMEDGLEGTQVEAASRRRSPR